MNAAPEPSTQWTHATVRAAIRKMWENGLPLSAQSAEQVYPGIEEAARKLYGSWAAAVVATKVEV